MNGDLLIRAATLVDGSRTDILVSDGRISALGTACRRAGATRHRRRRPARPPRPRRSAHPPEGAGLRTQRNRSDRVAGRRSRRLHRGPRHGEHVARRRQRRRRRTGATPAARPPGTPPSARSAPSPSGSAAPSSRRSARWPAAAPGCGSSPMTASASADALLMRRALEYVKAFGGVVAQHAQDPRAHRRRPDERGRPSRPNSDSPAGPRSPRSRSSPATSCWPQHVGSRLHVCHLSTAGVRRGRPLGEGPRHRRHRRGDPAPPVPHRGVRRADTTPGSRSTRRCGAQKTSRPCARASPTARSTSSPPTTRRIPREAKECEWDAAAFGMVGLESALSVVQASVVDTGFLDWTGRRAGALVHPGPHRPAARVRLRYR